MATEEVENKAPLGQQPAAAAGTEEAQTLASQRDRAPMIRRGAKGEEIAAATNYIRLRFIGNCTIHESHVDFDPPLDSTMMKNRSVRAVMGDRTYTFDGRMLFTTVNSSTSCSKKALGRVMRRRNYYDVKGVKHKLDIWPGYCIAVDEQEGGLMLCLDAYHQDGFLAKDAMRCIQTKH
ncbi:Protein argonaute-3 [Folsomia candida]|uniref:Protein argonaute-3 n=1 Tax=Folsomia candida TaxID=158441 RepID=A0A226DFQ8_FOLCA|nr:Protein argonaute-3 [Folsomia candida]